MRLSVCAGAATAAAVGIVATLVPVASTADISSAEILSGRRTTVALAAVAPAVVIDTPVAVTGTVSGPKKRKVMLELQVPGGWRVLSKGRTGKDRSFAFQAPTYWYGHHVLRVRAPAVKKRTGTVPTGRSRAVSVDVAYEYTPVGDPNDYELLFGGARWNPCKVIGWRYNPSGGFAGSLDVLNRALLQLTRATGLRFKYEGTTTKVPFVDKVNGVADLVIGWATEDAAPEVSGQLAGYGAVKGSGPSRKKLEYFLGMVVLDPAETGYEPSYDPSTPGGQTWGQVMLHELGHTVGLMHAVNPDQVMFPGITAAAPGLGDLTGFGLVGASGGCWDQGAR